MDIVKLSKVSQYKFETDELKKMTENDVFNESSSITLTGTSSDEIIKNFNDKFESVILRNRLTRSTANNPDSSRGHLFVKINFKGKDNNDDFNLYISDLAGAEDPSEFLGIARTEGYWVLLSLKQLQAIMGKYSQFDNNIPIKDVNDFVPNKDNPGYSNYVEDGKWKGEAFSFIPIEYVNVFTKNQAINALDSGDILKSIVATIKDSQSSLFKDQQTGKSMYNIMNSILHWGVMNNEGAKINKVITFINVKQTLPAKDSNKFKTVCQATQDSLLYGESLLSLDNRIKGPDGKLRTKFGRMRRRSYIKRRSAGGRRKRIKSKKKRRGPRIVRIKRAARSTKLRKSAKPKRRRSKSKRRIKPRTKRIKSKRRTMKPIRRRSKSKRIKSKRRTKRIKSNKKR
jgi:hypothetical protein